jgi:hypothetical protein
MTTKSLNSLLLAYCHRRRSNLKKNPLKSFSLSPTFHSVLFAIQSSVEKNYTAAHVMGIGGRECGA